MSTYDPDFIRVAGAREHNLRDVSLTLKKNQLIVFTGVSGSGKSSFAFDTLFAEGQRRYVESLSAYARQFIGQLPKPDVDQITGLAPSISIQQKSSGWNPRSTVGTITQIHDYLRVLLARAGTQHCPQCGKPITAQTRDQMIARAQALGEGTQLMILAPKARGQKGEFLDLFAELVHQGFVRARVDGELIELAEPPALDRYRKHNIEVVIDRLTIRENTRSRLAEAIDLAVAAGNGTAILARLDPRGLFAGPDDEGPAIDEASAAESGSTVDFADFTDSKKPRVAGRRTTAAKRRSDPEEEERALPRRASSAAPEILLSAGFACTACGLGFEPPTPQMFSFNSPQGMCSNCDGLGSRFDFDPNLLVPDPTKNFLDPCVVALRTKPGKWRRHLYEGAARQLGVSLKTPWQDLPAAARKGLLYGTGDAHITFEWKGRFGTWKHGGVYEGVIAELSAKYKASDSPIVRGYYEQFMRESPCQVCRGGRLNPQSLAVRLPVCGTGFQPVSSIRWLNINDICSLSIRDALAFFNALALDGVRALIAEEPLKEIRARLEFLLEVGLDYLTLDRSAPSLSGGESQRIRLASQIGCGLVGVLYVLDEPSIGLHPRDNRRLLRSLQRLRDMGNTVIVVEHDRDTMEAADHIVDFGPGPGVRGGRVVAEGGVETVSSAAESVTGAYLSGRRRIEIPANRRPITSRPSPVSTPAPRRPKASKSAPRA